MKEYKFRINGNDYEVAIEKVEDGTAQVLVNGQEYSVEIGNDEASGAKAAQQPAAAAASQPAAARSVAGGSAGSVVTSPIPGIVVGISVTLGQAVRRGQTVAVVEAMKMENEIPAEADGTVTAVFAAVGDTVQEGARLLSIG